MLSTIPEDRQKEIQRYLSMNFYGNNPYKPLSGDEILSELAESRALDEIGVKYGL